MAANSGRGSVKCRPDGDIRSFTSNCAKQSLAPLQVGALASTRRDPAVLDAL